MHAARSIWLCFPCFRSKPPRCEAGQDLNNSCRMGTLSKEEV